MGGGAKKGKRKRKKRESGEGESKEKNGPRKKEETGGVRIEKVGLRLRLILLHFRFNPQSPGECSSAIKDQKKLAFREIFSFFLSVCRALALWPWRLWYGCSRFGLHSFPCL